MLQEPVGPGDQPAHLRHPAATCLTKDSHTRRRPDPRHDRVSIGTRQARRNLRHWDPQGRVTDQKASSSCASFKGRDGKDALDPWIPVPVLPHPGLRKNATEHYENGAPPSRPPSSTASPKPSPSPPTPSSGSRLRVPLGRHAHRSAILALGPPRRPPRSGLTTHEPGRRTTKPGVSPSSRCPSPELRPAPRWPAVHPRLDLSPT